MAVVRDDVGKAVRETIDRVLREKLGPSGFRDGDVRAGTDHDGDPMLFVVAHFDLVREPIDPAITFDIIRVLGDALGEIGETRFPLVRYDFHDDQVMLEKKRKRG